jgi:hypothetical protein
MKDPELEMAGPMGAKAEAKGTCKLGREKS